MEHISKKMSGIYKNFTIFMQNLIENIISPIIFSHQLQFRRKMPENRSEVMFKRRLGVVF